MRIGILINARIGSKRLPKKHLRDIGGVLAIERLMQRVKIDDEFVYILATGHEHENRILENSAKKCGFHIFYGDAMNIPNRHLQAAKKHELDAIISLDGDDLLVSLEALETVSDRLREGKQIVKTIGLPFGFNILISYTIPALERCAKKACRGSYDTNWLWLFDNEEIHYIKYEIPRAEEIRSTLDYPEDLKYFRAVFSECPKAILANDTSLCKWIIENRVCRINKKRHLT